MDLKVKTVSMYNINISAETQVLNRNNTVQIFSDTNTNPIQKIPVEFKLIHTEYDSNNQIKVKEYRSEITNSTIRVYYFNNIPLKKYDEKSSHSLIKDNLSEFVKNNINADNIEEFLLIYGQKEFVKDLFINPRLSNELKDETFQYMFDIADKSAQQKYENYKKVGITSEIKSLKESLTEVKNYCIPDGNFEGDISQTSKMDCIILGRLIAILSRPKGKQALEHLVETDGNGNSTVTFRGLDKKVTVSYKEFCDDKYFTYSEGNADVKVLEIAWNKLTRRIGGIDNPVSNYAFDVSLLGLNAQGIPNPIYFNPNPFVLDKKLCNEHYREDFNNPNKAYVLGFNALNYVLRLGVKLITEDGFERKLVPAHEYAVIKADDDYIYLKNPHDSSEVLKLKWNDFNRLSFIVGEIKL